MVHACKKAKNFSMLHVSNTEFKIEGNSFAFAKTYMIKSYGNSSQPQKQN